MQLFVRCGAPLGSVALECGPEETVLHLKDRLAARAPQLLGPASSMVRAGRAKRGQAALHCMHACMHWSTGKGA